MFHANVVGVLVILVVSLTTVKSAKVIPRPLIRKVRSIETDDSPNIKFAVVLDAGSTSTRVRVYRYIQTADQDISPADISEMPINGMSKVKPGISSYTENPADAAASLQPLIAAAKATVQQDFHSKTNIFLFATAGIRSLQLDPNTKEAADEIMKQVSQYLSSQDNNPFVFQNDFARVISGQEESVFSWITINWLKGVLGTDKSTFGTLDLGGSSAEVGYEYETNNDNTFKLKLKNSEKLVYAVAHEHFGTEEARKMHMIKLIEKNKKNTKIVKSPCYNKGYSEMYTFNGKEYEFKGYGNARKCSILDKTLFTTKNTCNVKPCDIDTTNQPKLTGPLYLFSGFYYSMKRIGLLVSDCEQTVTFPEINVKLNKYCKLSNEQLIATGDIWAKYTCFMVSYSKALLTEGLDIQLDEAQLIVVGEIKGVKIGWSLGAILYNLHLL